jgi:DNA-binding transcriptional MerR regulator
MDKNPDAFRTISEVAQSLDLPQHVLRFWESRFPQIKPLKRGGGRRYYRPDDVELLRAIKRFLYDEGYTIKGVQRLFKEQGARAVVAKSLAEDGATEPKAVLGTPASSPADAIARAAEHGQDMGLSSSDIEILQAALAELAECERILSNARAR